MSQKLIRGRYAITNPARLPSGGLIKDGAVAVERDKVVAAGPFAQLRDRFPRADELGTEHHLVMPGLVNTHHHGQGLSTIQMGLRDDLLEFWLTDFWAHVKPLDAYLDTLYGDLKLIRSGVTTVLHAGYNREPGNLRAEAFASLHAHDDAGLRVAFGVQARDQNSFGYEPDDTFLSRLSPELAARVRAALAEFPPFTTDDYFALVDDLFAAYGDHPRVTLLLCPFGPQWCSDDLLRRLRAVGTSYGAGLHLHCLESPFQREYGRTSYGVGTVEHLNELGFLGSDVSLAHAVWMTEREMDICAATGTSVCHNASSNLRLRCGILPAALLLEKGVNVSIGTDGMGLNDDDDMLQELRLVARLHGLPRALERLPCPTSADVLRMATVNGARSTTIGPAIGTLEPGAKADVVLIDLDAVAGAYLNPSADVVDALLYRGRASHVDTVLVDGEVILSGGRFTKVDEDAITGRLVENAAAPAAPRVARLLAALEELLPHAHSLYTGWTEPEFRPAYMVDSVH
ncbi:MAG: amidohydrolase family protein [Actinomycetota bacterium]|nr:amidohydrolase family protein [Actinomycetota bacterium]